MSSIIRATWADIGYRRCGQLPHASGEASAERIAENLQKQLGYEVVENVWVRRPGRSRASAKPFYHSLICTIDRETNVATVDFSFIERVLNAQEWGSINLVEPLEYSALVRLVESARAKSTRELAVQAISKAIILCREPRLAPLLRDHILPWFFEKYPNGRVVCIGQAYAYERAMAAIRGFYTMAQVPYPEIGANLTSYSDQFPTLKYLHST